MKNISNKPLAIVGLACRLPGADNIDEYWDLLIQGRSELGELPPERFNHELNYSGSKGDPIRSYATKGGAIPERPVDRSKCLLSEEDISATHKQQLNLCEVAYDACANAGYDPANMACNRAGTYVGHAPPGNKIGRLIQAYQIRHSSQIIKELDFQESVPLEQQDQIIQEMVEAVRSEYPEGCELFDVRPNSFYAAATISKAFNLSGPAMSFDAACASGLYAFSAATNALQLGEIDMALVGSASYTNADLMTLFSQAQTLSATGTRPFDDSADGLIPSEGYVVLVIKTLEKAIADGDDVKAVIRGVGVSSDGKGKSLWAPLKQGQMEAIRRAYTNDVSPADLQFLEMHATSTQVGDATEMSAITEALSGYFPEGQKIPVGSVKANIGHTLETAGMASLVKSVLAMRNGMIPPQINVTQPNTNIDWENIPFYVPQQAYSWPEPAPGRPRLSAVNAFGIGGLNVHIVLEGYEPTYSANLVKQQPPAVLADDENAIAIVGRGGMVPGTLNVDELWNDMTSGENHITSLPEDRWDGTLGIDQDKNHRWSIPPVRGGFITGYEYDWKKHKVPPKQVLNADPLQFMLLDATDAALRDAGYADDQEKTLDKNRTGVIVGTVFGGQFTNELQNGLQLTYTRKILENLLRNRGLAEEKVQAIADDYQARIIKRYPAIIDETGSFTASTLASRISKTFNLKGGAVAVDSGDCSTFAALSVCVDNLRTGITDVMICASGQRSLDYASYAMLKGWGALSTQEEALGPFDEGYDGSIPGEAVGAVVLKRLADAKRDGDPIRGIIRGIGVARNNDLVAGVEDSMSRALEKVNITPDAVSFVETGSGGAPGDSEWELEGINRVFGTDSRKAPLYLGTAASRFGFPRGSAGATALIAAMAELGETALPNSPQFKTPAEMVKQTSGRLMGVNQETKLTGLNADGNVYGAINSFSEAKVTYSVLLEGPVKLPLEEAPVRSDENHAPVAEAQLEEADAVAGYGDYAIARLSASDLLELQQRAEMLPMSDWKNSKFVAGDDIRLAIVARDTDELVNKLLFLVKVMENPSALTMINDKGIFWSQQSSPGKVAFMFPGQGSQYIGMLKTLVEQVPAAAAAREEIDAALSALNLPSFKELAWDDECSLNAVERTQVSLIAANFIMYRVMTDMGVKPERVCGHSFGELSALLAAGSWSLQDAVQATLARVNSVNACGGHLGILVSTTAPADLLQRLCDQVEGRVWISHLNAPDQTVIGGDEEPVRQVAALAEAEGFRTLQIDVPAAFHTPLLEDVQVPFRKELEKLEIQPPMTPLLSSVSNKYVADPTEIIDNLVTQMVRPIDYVSLVNRLIDDNVKMMVEVGPRQVLTGLNNRIMDIPEITAVCSNHAKRNELEQLTFVRACAEVYGCLDDQSRIIAQKSAAISRPQEEISEPVTEDSNVIPDVKEHELIPEEVEIPVLRLSGTPYEMGQQQGQELKNEIRAILRRYTDLAGTQWDHLFQVEQAVESAGQYFSEEALQELQGIADGAAVNLNSLIAHNIRLYQNSGQGGLSVVATAETSPETGLLHATNEELQNGLPLKKLLKRHVQIRVPQSGIASLSTIVPGQVGALSGINASGLAVSATCLLDVSESSDTGMLSTSLVQNILNQATDIDSAINLIKDRSVQGAWTLCLSHAASDRVCYMEFDGPNVQIQPSLPTVIAANHTQLASMGTEHALNQQQRSVSEQRVSRMKELLGGDELRDVSTGRLFETLRDKYDLERQTNSEYPTAHTIRRADNQISLVMQPAEGKVWLTPGPTANGHQDHFNVLDLTQLLPGWNGTSIADSSEQSTVIEPKEETRSEVVQADSSRVISASEVMQAFDSTVAANPEAVCQRHVLRLIERVVPETAFPQLSGPAIIFGDNPAGIALKAYLEANGVGVMLIPSDLPVEQATAAIDAQWDVAPAPHLFVMTACDEAANMSLEPNIWNSRRDLGVMNSYLVCQKWFTRAYQDKMLNSCTLAAVTQLGGDFGLSGQIKNVESGALTGLLKAVRMESEMQHMSPGFTSLILDVESNQTPETIAERLCSELAARHGEQEVGYQHGKRYFVRPYAQLVEETQNLALQPGDNIVVTGGARGVTAVVARELAKRFPGAVLHLVGSSPLPELSDSYHSMSEEEIKDVKASVFKEAIANGEKPMDAWGRFEKALEIDATLREFKESGMDVYYHGCDIGNREALSQVLEAVRAQSGPIKGIIHGAGFEKATRYDKKQENLVRRTVGAKVDGAANLLALTQNDPLKFLVSFGSISGRLGGVGQTDYSMANDMLAKLMAWSRANRPECATSVFHWHAWDDVGMAVRPESQHIRKLHNIKFMPSLEGAKHLLDEIANGMLESEILVTECSSLKEHCAADLNEPVVSSEPVAAPQTAEELNVSLPPLVDKITAHLPGQELTAELYLDPSQDEFLKQHLFKGKPMFPLVAAMEAMAETAQLLAGTGQIVTEIRDLKIKNSIRFSAEQPMTIRLKATQQPSGIHVELGVDMYNTRGILLQENRPCFHCSVMTAAEKPVVSKPAPPEPEELYPCDYPDKEGAVIYHGPMYRSMKQIGSNNKVAIGYFDAPEWSEFAGRRARSGWVTPSSMLDGSFFGSGIYLWLLRDGAVALPNGIRSFKLYDTPQPGEKCTNTIHFQSEGETTGLFNIVMYDSQNRVLFEVEGYENNIIPGAHIPVEVDSAMNQ